MPIIRGHHTFEDHYTQIPNAWLRDTRISFKARGLLAQIMSHRSGWNVSINSLAEVNLEGRDSIRAAVLELESAGYLSRSQQNEGGRFGEAIWTTCDPTDLPMTENPTTENPTTKKNILKEQQELKKHPQAELEGEFEEFWKIYPRKVEKLAARKAYAKAVGEFGSVAVLAGVQRLARDPNLPPKQFIPYPASWLNAGGWESEPYPEREKSKEELEAIRAEQYKRRREIELAEAAERRAEAKAVEERLKANPPKRCEHDRVAVICTTCARKNVRPDQ